MTVWLRGSVFESMVHEAARAEPDETGGVLMGYWSIDRGEVVVTDMIGPGPAAEHNRATFRPDGKFQQIEIERIYTDSGRISTYLGDWHTHPGGGSLLSDRDRATLRSVALDTDARASRPLMAILDRRPDWEITVWLLRLGPLGRWGRSSVVSLKVQIW